jgi:hypothetical protein
MIADIERVLTLIRPAERERDRCAEAVRASVQHVKDGKRPTRAAEHRRLCELEKDLKKVQRSLHGLPEYQRHMLDDIDKLRSSGGLQRYESDTELIIATTGKVIKYVDEKRPVRRSGGKGGAESLQKMRAAREAYLLLRDFGGRSASLTRGGAYFVIAGLLFKLATGTSRDLERVCSKVYKAYSQATQQ